jgi:DNA-binding NarL/FixJ family response regulator
MSQVVRILIADDHPIFRKGLREVLEEVEGFSVIGEAGDGEAALHAIEAGHPDIVILDVNMPKLDGFGVLKALKDAPSRPEFVLMTMHGREDLLRAAFDMGVHAYLVKEGAMVDVVDAIRAVREGRPYISSELSASLLTGRGAPAPQPSSAAPNWKARLTPAETRVLRLIAEFKTSKEIAQELSIHYRTVENHRTAIAAKLGLSGSHALTKFAVENRALLLESS